ncbi:hypothetical protein N7403_31700 [Pseudomonas nitroreducens]|uniref:hypothetical protein n=1 Tax=Pseudomonas nitroreducens TaxID=46680 RepID=UPI00244C637C|nr:hypothetical protein [Pseudomonas nitroreducens]MDG9858438.1 hypothetical protein [Pseudomonas nitroreducens]
MPEENQSSGLAPNLLHILQHSLGLDEYGQGRQYRNHYVAGGDDVRLCRELVALGYMSERAASALSGGDPWFSVTPVGIVAVAKFSPPAPPPPKRTNFDAYLDECECYDGFAHFLGINMPMFQQRGEWGNREYRMVRYPRGSVYRQHRRHYNLTQWSPYETLEVAGEWAPTMKEAKASYKSALKAYRDNLRAERAALYA